MGIKIRSLSIIILFTITNQVFGMPKVIYFTNKSDFDLSLNLKNVIVKQGFASIPVSYLSVGTIPANAERTPVDLDVEDIDKKNDVSYDYSDASFYFTASMPIKEIKPTIMGLLPNNSFKQQKEILFTTESIKVNPGITYEITYDQSNNRLNVSDDFIS